MKERVRVRERGRDREREIDREKVREKSLTSFFYFFRDSVLILLKMNSVLVC